MTTPFFLSSVAVSLRGARCALRRAIVPLALALTAAAAPVHAGIKEVAGIKVSDHLVVAGQELPLNGTGVRFRGPFRVYVAALYVNQKVTTAEEFFAARGPKRLTLTMLRDVDASEMGHLFVRGIQGNTPPGAMSKVMPALPRMGDIFAQQKKLAAGDVLVLDWVPQIGMVVTAKGKTIGEPFRDPEFFEAMLNIWLGKSPADWMLKDALLARNI